ncbi:MAG: hypothetical protein ACXU86_17990 [Archangium sp.]
MKGTVVPPLQESKAARPASVEKPFAFVEDPDGYRVELIQQGA